VTENPQHLADTSAWIQALRPGATGPWPAELKSLITERRLGIQPVIRVELLSGARSEAEYRQLSDSLDALPLLEMTQPVWGEAERLGFSLRKRGINIPVTDFLIAATAIVHKCTLHHRDRHFPLIARHSSLKVLEIPD